MARKQMIESVVVGAGKYPPPRDFKKKAHINSLKEYQRLYKHSVEDPKGFWAERAEALTWYK